MNRSLALLFLVLAPSAQAATCTMSATDLRFGQYRSGSAIDVDATSTVTLECMDDSSGAGVGYSIAISAGGSGNPADRTMGGALHYNVFTDASRTTVWGNGTGSSIVSGTIPAPGTGIAAHTAYGTIPAGQSPPVGSYGDALTITIDY